MTFYGGQNSGSPSDFGHPALLDLLSGQSFNADNSITLTAFSVFVESGSVTLTAMGDSRVLSAGESMSYDSIRSSQLSVTAAAATLAKLSFSKLV